MHYDKDKLYVEQMDDGEKLYHYTTFDALLSIVNKNQFWVTKWDYLNDQDEFKIAIDVLEKVLIKENVCDKLIQDVKKELKDDVENNGVLNTSYILSFSLNPDSQLMWSYYSKHDGLNIKIDFGRFEKYLVGSTALHGKVIYDFNQQMECMEKSLRSEIFDCSDLGNIHSWDQIKDITDEKQYRMLVSHITVICMLYSMFFKKECFRDEREYRVVYMAIEGRDTKKFRSKEGGIVPYIEKHFSSLEFLDGVTIGPTNRSDIAAKGVSEFLAYNGCTATVTKSQMPLRY